MEIIYYDIFYVSSFTLHIIEGQDGDGNDGDDYLENDEHSNSLVLGFGHGGNV